MVDNNSIYLCQLFADCSFVLPTRLQTIYLTTIIQFSVLCIPSTTSPPTIHTHTHIHTLSEYSMYSLLKKQFVPIPIFCLWFCSFSRLHHLFVVCFFNVARARAFPFCIHVSLVIIICRVMLCGTFHLSIQPFIHPSHSQAIIEWPINLALLLVLGTYTCTSKWDTVFSVSVMVGVPL